MAAAECMEHTRPPSDAGKVRGSLSECPDRGLLSEAPDRMFEHIQGQLKALEGVPKQLHAVLDSVAHLRSQLEELRLAGAPGEGRRRSGGRRTVRTATVESAGGLTGAALLSPEPSMSAALTRFVMGQKTNRANSMLSDLADPGEAAIRSRGGNCYGDGRHAHGHGTQSMPVPGDARLFEDLNQASSEDHLDPVLPNAVRSSATSAAAYGSGRARVSQEQHFDSLDTSRKSSCASVPPSGREGSMQGYVRVPGKSSRVQSSIALTRSSVASQSGNTSSENIDGWSLCVKNKFGSGMERRASICIDIASKHDLQKRSSPLILLPNGHFRLAWTLVLVGLTVFIGISIPLRLAYFDTGAITSGVVGHMLHVADACWIIDIIISFHTAFYKHGILVCNQWHIAANYVRTWLVLDMIASYPLFLASTDTAIRTCGFLKLARLFHLGSQLSSMQKGCRFAKLLPLRAVLYAALLSHALSCAWRVAQLAERPASTGDPGTEWWADYVADLYWLQMTMTTVGYGDIVPRGTPARLFAIVVMFVAPIFFGSVVSILGHITGDMLDDEEEKHASEADRLMRRHGVPIDLRRRVDHNLRHHIRQEDQIMNATKLLGKLSPGMQRELSLEFLGNTMMMFPLFQDAPRAFIADVAQAHTWLQCLPGNLVVEAGQPAQELVFVVHGLVMKQPCGEREQLGADPCHQELEAGSWFGEVCLFRAGAIREFSAYAVVESELAVLAAGDYSRILQKYPPQLARHRALERGIHSKRLSLTDIACVPRFVPRTPSALGRMSFMRRRSCD